MIAVGLNSCGEGGNTICMEVFWVAFTPGNTNPYLKTTNMKMDNIHKENNVEEMSRDKGKLIPVESSNKAAFAEFIVTKIDPGYLGCRLTKFLDHPEGYGYKVLNDVIYKLEWDWSDDELCTTSLQKDGSILFDACYEPLFYDLDTLLEDSLKEITHDK